MYRLGLRTNISAREEGRTARALYARLLHGTGGTEAEGLPYARPKLAALLFFELLSCYCTGALLCWYLNVCQARSGNRNPVLGSSYSHLVLEICKDRPSLIRERSTRSTAYEVCSQTS